MTADIQTDLGASDHSEHCSVQTDNYSRKGNLLLVSLTLETENAYFNAEQPIDAMGHPVTNIEKLRYRACYLMVCDVVLAIYTIMSILVLALVLVGLINGHLESGIQIDGLQWKDLVPHFSSASKRHVSMSKREAASQPFHDGSFWSTKQLDSRYVTGAFLFHVLPTFLIGPIFINLWYSADIFYRRSQPFASMSMLRLRTRVSCWITPVQCLSL